MYSLESSYSCYPGMCPTTRCTVGMWKSLVPVHKCWNKFSDACLQKLCWPSLSLRRNYLRVATLYDILHGRYDSLKLSHFCVFNLSCTRAHPLSVVPRQSTINSFRYSFFVNTVLPYTVLTLKASNFLYMHCFVVISFFFSRICYRSS